MKKKKRNATFRDRTGDKVGLLTVLGEIETDMENVLWECECECGTVVRVTSSNLKNKRHCGCKARSNVISTNGHRGPINIHPVLIGFLHSYHG